MLIIDESAFWASNLNYFYNADFVRRTRGHIEEWVKRDRNHPSVVIWSMENEALTAHCWFPNPGDGAATLAEFRETMRSLVEVIAALDPSRPINGDGDGDLLGLLPIFSLHYHGLLPTQGVTKPITFGESGSMFYATPPELAYLTGEKVFESYDQRMHAVGKEMTSFIQERRKWAALITPFNVVWYALEPLPFKERRLHYTHPGGPGIKPERIGPYSSTLNPGVDPDLPAWRPTALYPYIRDSLMPVRFFFNQHDTTFYGGNNLSRTFTVHNDAPRRKDLSFTWRLEEQENARVLASGSVALSLEPAEFREIEITFSLPAVEEPLVARFVGELMADGVLVYGEGRRWTIYPECIPLRIGNDEAIGVFGEGPGVEALTGMGLCPRVIARDTLDVLASLRLLVVDLHGVSISQEEQEVILAAVGEGLRCVVFGPAATMEGIFGQRIEIRPVREDWSHAIKTNEAVYPAVAAVAEGLFLEDLRHWAPDGLVGGDYTFGGILPGNSRPLLVDGYNESVCLALYRGKGMILLCGIDLPRKQEIVPAAKVLYRNLLEYALDSDPLPRVRAGLLAEEDSELCKLLRILGAEVTFVDRDTSLEGLEVLVADGAKTPGFLPDPQTLRARIAEGMQLVIHNLTPETLPYYQELLPEEIGLRPSAREEQIKTAPEDPLLAGFNNADMYWLAQGLVNPIVDYGVDVSRAGSATVLTQAPRTNWRSWAWRPEHVKTVAVLRSERDNPETVNGLVTIPLGKGRIVIDQIRASVQNEKSRRILSLLLTNLGVPLADHPADIETLIGADGYILQWLVLGSFPADNIESWVFP